MPISSFSFLTGDKRKREGNNKQKRRETREAKTEGRREFLLRRRRQLGRKTAGAAEGKGDRLLLFHPRKKTLKSTVSLLLSLLSAPLCLQPHPFLLTAKTKHTFVITVLRLGKEYEKTHLSSFSLPSYSLRRLLRTLRFHSRPNPIFCASQKLSFLLDCVLLLISVYLADCRLNPPSLDLSC